MASLNYNKDIFTEVYKFDEELSYLGVKISGKLNQYNGQDYPLLDAIDIDWDGAFVHNLNTYIYTTEDLINCLNNSYYNFTNYVSKSYYDSYSYSVINQMNDYHSYIIGQFDTKISYLLELIYGINFSIDNINNIALDRSNFYTVNYNDIVNPNGTIKFKNRIYYIMDEIDGRYKIVDYQYVLAHPNIKYYFNIVDNILEDMTELDNINNFIGTAEYDSINDEYTYTGLLEKLYNYDIDINEIKIQLDETSYIANDAYTLAYLGYSYVSYISPQVEKNTYTIGYHTSYNVYKPISEMSLTELNDYLEIHHNLIYTYDDESLSYKAVSYNNNFTGDYYVHYNVVYGQGIEREIELLESKIYDNSYLLYKLNAESDDPDYIGLYITPQDKVQQERTIHTNIYQSNVNTDTGVSTKGIITNTGLKDSFSYVFNWKILNK